MLGSGKRTERTARDWDDAEKLSLIETTRWSTNLRVATPERSGRSLYYFWSLDLQAIALTKKAEYTARDWDDAERTTIDKKGGGGNGGAFCLLIGRNHVGALAGGFFVFAVARFHVFGEPFFGQVLVA